MGFVVPGAAAGVGVREAVLVLILEQHLGADAALLVALALRVVTTLGDLLFFGALLPHAGARSATRRSRSVLEVEWSLKSMSTLVSS